MTTVDRTELRWIAALTATWAISLIVAVVVLDRVLGMPLGLAVIIVSVIAGTIIPTSYPLLLASVRSRRRDEKLVLSDTYHRRSVIQFVLMCGLMVDATMLYLSIRLRSIGGMAVFGVAGVVCLWLLARVDLQILDELQQCTSGSDRGKSKRERQPKTGV